MRTLVILFLASASFLSAQFPTGWTRRCALTIDHTKVPSTQTNIPVLIGYNAVGSEANLPQEMLVTGGTNAALSDGADVRFSSDLAGTTGLHYEIVTWTQDASTDASRKAEIWVKIPSLSSSADTTIYVWYKNAGASAPAANDATFGSQGVWSGYAAAYHFKYTGSTFSGADSTSNAVTAISAGGAEAGTASGYIGGGLVNDTGVYTQSVIIPHSSATNISTGSSTISVWGKATANTSYGTILAKFDSNWAWFPTVVGSLSNGYYNYGGGGNYFAADISTGSWHRFTMVVDSSANTLKLYLDGTLLTTVTSWSNYTGSTADIYMLGWASGVWNGYLDEPRISATAASADWLTTEYNNQSAPSTFWTVGTPATVGTTSPTGFVGHGAYNYVL